jgi:hypothetical protein
MGWLVFHLFLPTLTPPWLPRPATKLEPPDTLQHIIFGGQGCALYCFSPFSNYS